MATNVMSRTFQKAAELAGGPKLLARRLRVPLAELEKWIAGEGQPPKAIFLKAVDLVLEKGPDTAGAAGREPDEPPPPRDCAAAGGFGFL